VEEPDEDPPDEGQPLTVNAHAAPINNDNNVSYFTDEEYTEVLEHFDELRNRSLKNSKTKTAVDKKDLTTFKRLKKEHYLELMGNHFKTLPLGGTDRFIERLDKFLVYHVGKRNDLGPFKDALKTLNVECAVRIDKESNQDAAIRTLLTRVPMVPLPTVSHICSGHMDSLVLLDRDDFYTCEMKNNALVFHRDPEHRLDALRRCLDGIVELFTPKSHPAEIIPKIQGIILKELKVPLPWDPQKVIAAVADDPESNSAYVQVYLCPLRNHIGKSPGSRTGELLSKVEEQFFSSNLVC